MQDPIYDLRVMIWTNLNPHILRMLHMKSLALTVNKKVFEVIFLYKSMLNFDPWAWPSLWPQGHDLNKLKSPCPKNALFEISKLWHLQFTSRRFLKSFSYTSLCSNLTPGHDPNYDPRVIIWTNLNPHVLRMLNKKYQCSGTYSSQEEDF